MKAIYDANGDLRPKWADIILKVQRDQDKHGASAGPEGAEAVEPNGNLQTGAVKSTLAAHCAMCNRAGSKNRVLKECRYIVPQIAPKIVPRISPKSVPLIVTQVYRLCPNETDFSFN